MTWSFEISTAPKGRNITVMRTARSKDGVTRFPVEEFEPDHVWLATKCGKVLKSYWIPETAKNEGRWAGLGTKEQPVAWQLYVVPAHPNSVSDLGLNIVTKHTEISNSKTAAATDIPEARTPLGHIKAVTGKSGAGAVESVCPASIDDVGGGA